MADFRQLRPGPSGYIGCMPFNAPARKPNSESPPAASRAKALGVAAMAVTVVFWASAFVGIRAIGPHFSPGSLTLGRLAVAAVVLSFLVLPQLLKSRNLPRGREWWPILAYGVMWFGGYNVALNAAEHVLDAGTSALLINVSPILVAIMAGFFLKEGFPRWLLIGSTVAFVGVALIALGSGPAAGTVPGAGKSATADLAGVALCLLAAVLAAVSVIIQKPVLRKFPAAQATWFGIMVGAVCCLPFAGQLASELQAAPPEATAGLVYLGVFPTAIAFTTWAYALSLVDAGKLAATTYLVPGVTVLISWLLLGEVPTAWGLAGGVICLLGVGLTRRRSRQGTGAPEAVRR